MIHNHATLLRIIKQRLQRKTVNAITCDEKSCVMQFRQNLLSCVAYTMLFLQTIHSCSSCTSPNCSACSACRLLSQTSTSVRVWWPRRYWCYHQAVRYTVNCISSTPGCRETVVARNTFVTNVTGLLAGTYYNFSVTNYRGSNLRSLQVHCAGTTGLYQSYL